MIEQYKKALSNFIKDRQPRRLIILGSGLGRLSEMLEDQISIPYPALGFPASAVSGHNGELILGRLNGQDILCMRGRFHLYEGHQPQVIKDVISAFSGIGVEELIVTNAAGSLSLQMPAGSIMMISDHINLSGFNPLIGPNDEKYGPRFVDMSQPYHQDLRHKAAQIAKSLKIKLFEGVYLMVSGPNFETAAEIRAFRTLGADAVGMSTVPEVLSAAYCGMKVLGFSVITNLGTGLQDKTQSHEETLLQANDAATRLTELLKHYLSEK